MSKTLNGEKLKNHFIYSWWKYLLVLLIGIFGVDLLYVVSEPRVADDAKMNIIAVGFASEMDLGEYIDRVCTDEMPDILEKSVSIIPDDASVYQYLTTRMTAREGELYILPRDCFQWMMSSGILLPLENDAELSGLLSGMEITEGYGNPPSSRDIHLYGIHLSHLAGLQEYLYIRDGFICVPDFRKNTENAVQFLHCLVRDMKTDPAAFGQPDPVQ